MKKKNATALKRGEREKKRPKKLNKIYAEKVQIQQSEVSTYVRHGCTRNKTEDSNIKFEKSERRKVVNTDDGRAHESIAMANGRVSKRAKQKPVQICFTRTTTM